MVALSGYPFAQSTECMASSTERMATGPGGSAPKGVRKVDSAGAGKDGVENSYVFALLKSRDLAPENTASVPKLSQLVPAGPPSAR